MSQLSNNQQLNSDYYYQQINPAIESTFTYEQQKAVRSVLKRATKIPSKKIVNVEVTFWFFKSFYIVFYLGLDKRKNSRRVDQNNSSVLLRWMVTLFVYVFIWGATLLFLSFIVYYTKSNLGIDIDPEHHLHEMLGFLN